MKNTNHIALSLAQSLFVISAESKTGIVWKKNNRPAGTVLPSGYCQVRIPGGNWFVYTHRIVWMLANNKEIPEGNYQVDHIDRDRTNNTPENLRLIHQYWNCIRREHQKADGLPSNIHKTSTGYQARFSFEGKGYKADYSSIKECQDWLREKRTQLVGIYHEV
ncbi:TPA: HNH endonuclease signature motif containing protein [Enterobacter hormaechei]|uniref:HNH endonuclease signature motif containing protein n=1 Tax=Enterobacter cloacae complex TaxID=354276 RepID=UPI00079B986B|nr:HNH endonuclease signature motif containing protein [Enterobacter hormaechei]HDR2757174.1 HNH endonuclease [Enterobacter mori]EKT9339883.1 HNH endonuclease [Enterobacter hormaechei]EKT9367261.1 HNH endonuclease [Enterobacter hormaechei]EKW5513694.1 HNH endonuclease [Enterobacter hormaechei]ELC7278000.1 HNH endonuclease [Enterobacter hormaechei]